MNEYTSCMNRIELKIDGMLNRINMANRQYDLAPFQNQIEVIKGNLQLIKSELDQLKSNLQLKEEQDRNEILNLTKNLKLLQQKQENSRISELQTEKKFAIKSCRKLSGTIKNKRHEILMADLEGVVTAPLKAPINNRFLTYIATQHRNLSAIAPVSKRQTRYMDALKYDINKNSLSFCALISFTMRLSSLINKDLHFYPLILEDFTTKNQDEYFKFSLNAANMINQKKPDLLSQHFLQETLDANDKNFGPHSKILILVFWAHFFQKLKKGDLIFSFYDTNLELLNDAYQFLSKNNHFLPEMITINFYYWSANINENLESMAAVQYLGLCYGTGKSLSPYKIAEIMRQIWKLQSKWPGWPQDPSYKGNEKMKISSMMEDFLILPNSQGYKNYFDTYISIWPNMRADELKFGNFFFNKDNYLELPLDKTEAEFRFIYCDLSQCKQSQFQSRYEYITKFINIQTNLHNILREIENCQLFLNKAPQKQVGQKQVGQNHLKYGKELLVLLVKEIFSGIPDLIYYALEEPTPMDKEILGLKKQISQLEEQGKEKICGILIREIINLQLKFQRLSRQVSNISKQRLFLIMNIDEAILTQDLLTIFSERLVSHLKRDNFLNYVSILSGSVQTNLTDPNDPHAPTNYLSFYKLLILSVLLKQDYNSRIEFYPQIIEDFAQPTETFFQFCQDGQTIFEKNKNITAKQYWELLANRLSQEEQRRWLPSLQSLVLIFWCHYFRSLEEGQLQIQFFDTNIDLIVIIYDLFSKNTSFLPRMVELKFYCWDNSSLSKAPNCCIGTGDVVLPPSKIAEIMQLFWNRQTNMPVQTNEDTKKQLVDSLNLLINNERQNKQIFPPSNNQIFFKNLIKIKTDPEKLQYGANFFNQRNWLNLPQSQSENN